MAHVTGPCSTLPGSHHAVPEGMTCDECSAPATKRIQGETDSFGAEYFDMCDACHAQWKADNAAHEAEARTGCCDWCKQHATDLRDKRDFEEGLSGPVYRVCGACVRRQNDRLAEEMDDRDDHYDPVEQCIDDHDDDLFEQAMDMADEQQFEAPNERGITAIVDAQAGLPGRGARAYVDGKYIY